MAIKKLSEVEAPVGVSLKSVLFHQSIFMGALGAKTRLDKTELAGLHLYWMSDHVLALHKQSKVRIPFAAVAAAIEE